MHSDKVTATGPEKKKQNLLITANISLRLSNDLLFSFPPCHISPSGGFAAVCSVCLAAHLPLWSPVWGILLSKHCFITGFPVRLHISLSTHSGFCSSHSEKKQDLSSQIVLSLVPVLPHSPSLWFICMRDSRGTSDSHSGSVDRYPALCAWACCVFLRVRQGTGGGGSWGPMKGKRSRQHGVPWLKRASNEQADFIHKLRACECATSCLRWINRECIYTVSQICSRKSLLN